MDDGKNWCICVMNHAQVRKVASEHSRRTGQMGKHSVATVMTMATLGKCASLESRYKQKKAVQV
jgi:hypothetical protein